MTREKFKRRPLKNLVNVAQLLKEPVGSSCNYDITEIIDGQAVSPAKGEITLIRSPQGILVRGNLTIEVELICSRCLNTFLYPMNFIIEEESFPTVDMSSGLPLSLPEESEGFTIDNNHMLDLNKLICQYVLLNLPMKPLCRPDCAGIKEMNSYGST